MKNYPQVLEYLKSLQLSVGKYRSIDRNGITYLIKPMYDAPSYYEIDCSDEEKLFIKLLVTNSTAFKTKRELRKRVNEIKRIIKMKAFI